MSSRPATLGQLRESGWKSVPVKEEIRRNAVTKIAAGEPLFDRVLGYETRSCRSWRTPSSPATTSSSWASGGRRRPASSARSPTCSTSGRRSWPGSEINDDPYAPVSRHARDLVHDKGDDTPIDVGPPRRALRREAGHARHVDRRPHRRGRPDQGGRGPVPVRRAHPALRPRAPHEPRHLRRSTSCPTSPSASRSAC